MGMTLDEYLEEVDRWKQALQMELDAMPPDEQRARLLEIGREVERDLGHVFPVAPSETLETAARS